MKIYILILILLSCTVCGQSTKRNVIHTTIHVSRDTLIRTMTFPHGLAIYKTWYDDKIDSTKDSICKMRGHVFNDEGFGYSTQSSTNSANYKVIDTPDSSYLVSITHDMSFHFCERCKRTITDFTLDTTFIKTTWKRK